jgi:osmotically-inducible protein OsmY
MSMRKIGALGIGAVAVEAFFLLRWWRKGRVVHPVDDVTLTQQVESELYGSSKAPKERLSVNAANGVVQLRGEVGTSALIDDLVRRARSVPGVRDVENLLHTPGSAAPMHQ